MMAVASSAWPPKSGSKDWGKPLIEVIEELTNRVEVLELYLSWDEELRKQNPALQDLFEKFQITKKLVE